MRKSSQADGFEDLAKAPFCRCLQNIFAVRCLAKMFVDANIDANLRIGLGRMEASFRIFRIYRLHKNCAKYGNWHDSMLIHRSPTSCP